MSVSPGTYVAIERVDANNYWLVQDLGGGQEWRVKLLFNGSTHCLQNSYVYEGGVAIETLFDMGSVWEYAFNDATYGWIGNGHGQDYQDSIAFTFDGVPVVLVDGQRATGASATITRVSHFEAPGPIALGDCTIIYSLNPATGLSTTITIDWDIAPVTGHGGMMPLNDRFSRGIIVGNPANYDLSIGEGGGTDISTPTISSALAYCWEYQITPGWVAMIQTGDGHSRDTYIQDRGTENLNKIYSQEAGENLGGNIRQFTNNYRVKKLNNPNLVFLGI